MCNEGLQCVAMSVIDSAALFGRKMFCHKMFSCCAAQEEADGCVCGGCCCHQWRVHGRPTLP